MRHEVRRVAGAATPSGSLAFLLLPALRVAGECAALAAIDAVERWVLPDVVAGEHNRLNTCLPAAASCPSVGPVEATRAIPAFLLLFERDLLSSVVNVCNIELKGQQQP
jgi:hypothetical protein